MKPRRKTPEQDFQKDVAQFLTLALPMPGSWFGAIPTTGSSKTVGGILKGMGYKAGTPDMLVIYRPREWQTSKPTVIWLELKDDKRGPSKAQEQCRDDLIAAGCKWALVRTLDDVERALRRFGVPLRASVGTGREAEKAVLLAHGAI